jgi:hypothetical protein
VPVFQHPEENFLHQILACMPVAREPSIEIIELDVMPFEQNCELAKIALTHFHHQLYVGGWAHAGRLVVWSIH